MSSQRIVFANELRGVAAVSVAISHLLGVYWFIREAVSWATFTPAQGGPVHPWAQGIVFDWFNFGPFGVGLFFLISGLVIPFSLDSHTRGSFLLARVLRIYPTYIVAVLLEVVMLKGNALLWGVKFTHKPWMIVSNMLLIQDLNGQPSLDLVNWTLCIELRFYLLVAVCAGLIRRGSVATLFGLALLCFGANLAVMAGALGPALPPDAAHLSYAASTEPLFIIFMLIGVLFNFHLRGRIGTPGLFLAVPAMAWLFVLCWQNSVLAYQYPAVTKNYLAALAVFAALYTVRRYVPRLRALDALAAISYPLYIVHALVGYSVIRLLMLRGHAPYPLALAAAVLVVVALATVLHRTVERATIHMGRRLARDWPRPGWSRVAAE